MKKYYIIYSVLAILCFKANAQREGTAPKFYQISRVSETVDSNLKKKIIEIYFGSDNTLDANTGYDLDNMLLASYDSTDVQAVHIKGINGNSSKGITIFVKGELVSDMAMKYDMVTDANGDSIIQIKDGIGEIVSYIKIASDGTIWGKVNPDWVEETDQTGYLNNSDFSVAKNGPSIKFLPFKKFWERWTSCVSTGLTQMFGGQHGVYATAAGVACVAFGPLCGAGAILGCAAHSAHYQ